MHLFSVLTASSLSVSDTHRSIFRPRLWRCRMEEGRGGRVSYSGKQRLKQLSKHCQQCSWTLENDLLVLLCVLSEVTRWRLWFLSWTPALALHHLRWCPTGCKTVSNLNFKNKWLVWENKCVSSFSISHRVMMVWYAQTWFISTIISCWLDKHMIAPATHLVDYSGIHEACYFSSKWRLCWNLPLRTQGQRPESQALYAHAKHATPGSLLLQYFTGSSGHSAAPTFSVLVHNPQLGVSIQTERSHLGKPRALNENWWQISH